MIRNLGSKLACTSNASGGAGQYRQTRSRPEVILAGLWITNIHCGAKSCKVYVCIYIHTHVRISMGTGSYASFSSYIHLLEREICFLVGQGYFNVPTLKYLSQILCGFVILFSVRWNRDQFLKYIYLSNNFFDTDSESFYLNWTW